MPGGQRPAENNEEDGSCSARLDSSTDSWNARWRRSTNTSRPASRLTAHFVGRSPFDVRRGLTLPLDLNLVAELASLALDLDPVVQELLERGGVKDVVVGRDGVVDVELVDRLGGSGFLGGGFGLCESRVTSGASDDEHTTRAERVTSAGKHERSHERVTRARLQGERPCHASCVGGADMCRDIDEAGRQSTERIRGQARKSG